MAINLKIIKLKIFHRITKQKCESKCGSYPYYSKSSFNCFRIFFNLYNINDKSSPYVMRLPTLFFAQKQEKARFNRTFQGGAGDRT